MSNSLLNISMITKESLRVLKNELGFAKGVNRQYDEKFANSGAKIGSVINIRKPPRFTTTSGAAINLQNVSDQSSALTLDTQQHVAFQFSSKEMTLSIDEFSDRYIKPAVAALANKIDYDGLQLYTKIWNTVGTPGTTPAALSTILAAGRKLSDSGCPVDGLRNLVMNPAAEASMVNALSALFQSSEQIKQQYEKGLMGIAAGFKWKMDQNIAVHTTGKANGDTVLVDQTDVADGDTDIHMDGFGASTTYVLKAGDVFTIGNVYAVNPQSRQSTGALQQFVVQADVVSGSGAGDSDVTFLPAIQSTGAYQNVTALPANDAAVTILGASVADSTVTPVNMAYHRDAFVLGMADLELPRGVDMASRASDPDAGLSVRIVKAYDINNDTFPCRLDVLYGWQAVYPELACRVQG